MKLQLFDNDDKLYFCHVLRGSRDGSVAKPQSMLNIAIFDPWQRSLFSRQRTPGKEPLLAGKLHLGLQSIIFLKCHRVVQP